MSPDVPMPTNPHEDEVWHKPRKGKPRVPQKSFDLRALLPVHRKKAMLPVPAVIPEKPSVYFIWEDAEPGELLGVLRAICDRVTYLGRSRSLVRVTVEDGSPKATHVPDPLGDLQLRVPGVHRLGYLIDKYRRDGGKPEPSPPVRYREVAGASRPKEDARTVFERLWIFRPQQSDPMLPVVAVLKVTQALRRAVLKNVHEIVCGCSRWEKGPLPCREARECYSKIPEVLSGHNPDCSPLAAPHVGFVALPFAHPWQRHADGSIKGVGVLTPTGIEQEALRLLARALHRVEADGLQIPGVGRWNLREVPADNAPLVTLDSRTWTNASRTWTTVTPIVFGHFPKPGEGGEARVVLDALKLVGVDPFRVVEVAVSQHSPIHGVPPAWSFKGDGVERDSQNVRRLVRHVTIQFGAPVRGPLVLGALRYFGLGLMRPWEE
jgi:CRISPR-associated protein Csb2